MQKREGRSFAAPPPPPSRLEPGRTGRKRWERPDVPRPVASVRVLLPSPDPMVPEMEEPDEVDALDFLSCEARRDVLAGSVAGFDGGAL